MFIDLAVAVAVRAGAAGLVVSGFCPTNIMMLL